MSKLFLKDDKPNFFIKDKDSVRIIDRIAARDSEEAKSCWEFNDKATQDLHALNVFLNGNSHRSKFHVVFIPKLCLLDEHLDYDSQPHIVESLGDLHRGLRTKQPRECKEIADRICESNGVESKRYNRDKLKKIFLANKSLMDNDSVAEAAKCFA